MNEKLIVIIVKSVGVLALTTGFLSTEYFSWESVGQQEECWLSHAPLHTSEQDDHNNSQLLSVINIREFHEETETGPVWKQLAPVPTANISLLLLELLEMEQS